MQYSKQANQIIDVNINRFSEGLKVVEDLTRFYLTDNKNLNLIREIKQRFWNIFGNVRKEVVFSRKSQQDLGRKSKFDRAKRNNLDQVLTINLKRCQESLRVLEEIVKILDSKLFGQIKQLRFKLYDLEKELLNNINKKFNPYLYVIIDIKIVGRKQLTEITRACIKGGATMIQLREPENTLFKQWITDARQIKAGIFDKKVKFIINNRADVAYVIDADGVHIGQTDISITDARKMLGDHKIIGVSVINITQAKKAEKNRADYIGVGAIFPTPTKPEASVVGTKTLQSIIKVVKIPVIAIGGINSSNAKQLLKLGVSGIAIISAVFKTDNKVKKNRLKSIAKNLKAF
jgi:thiamine-phosphate pyrophosphorylase